MSTITAARHPFRGTAIAGLLAGSLDLSFAFIFYWVWRGISPARILSGIASGLLGPGSSTAGAWSVVLGAVLHFFISLCAAFVYLGMSRNFPLLTRQPLPCGAAFGVGMFVFMRFVVIPLSRIPFHFPSTLTVVGELFSHIFLFGMVIAVGVARATRRVL